MIGVDMTWTAIESLLLRMAVIPTFTGTLTYDHSPFRVEKEYGGEALNMSPA